MTEDEELLKIAKALQVRLVKMGYLQADVSRATGISKNQISRAFQGQRINVLTLLKICAALELDLLDMINNAPIPEKSTI